MISTTVTGSATTATGEAFLCLGQKAPTITPIVDQNATAGAAFTLQVNATFYGSNTSISYADNTTLFNIDANGLISFTPAAGDVGTHSILITVEDSSGCLTTSSTEDFKITISAAEEEEPAPSAPPSGGGGGVPLKKMLKLPFSLVEREITLSIGDEAEFSFGKIHTLKLNDVAAGKATFTISSTPKTVTLEEGQEIEIDVDDDGIKDLYIKLKSTRGRLAILGTKSLREGFILSEELMKVNLRKSQELKKGVFVINDWGGELDVVVTNQLSNVLVSPEIFNLKKSLRREISFILNPYHFEPGVSTGAVNFLAKDNYDSFSKSITVILEIVSDEILFDLSLDLFKKSLLPAEELEVAVSIFNPRRTILENVNLVYSILDLNNNNIFNEEETITIEEQASFSRKIKLPANIKPGDYVLSLKAVHEESAAVSSELFTIEEPKSALVGLAAPVTRRSVYLFALPLLLITIILVFAALYLTHKRINKTKKGKTIIKQKTIIKEIRPKEEIDTKRLRSKLALLRESHLKGYITEKTYKNTKANIERLIKKR